MGCPSLTCRCPRRAESVRAASSARTALGPYRIKVVMPTIPDEEAGTKEEISAALKTITVYDLRLAVQM